MKKNTKGQKLKGQKLIPLPELGSEEKICVQANDAVSDEVADLPLTCH